MDSEIKKFKLSIDLLSRHQVKVIGHNGFSGSARTFWRKLTALFVFIDVNLMDVTRFGFQKSERTYVFQSVYIGAK